MFGICTLCQLPHFVLAAALVLSAVRSFRWQRHAQVTFHALVGAILLFAPNLLHGPMAIWTFLADKFLFQIVGGAFDEVHVILQRFTAPFHIGFAFFHFAVSFCNNKQPASSRSVNAMIIFAKSLVAAFVLANRLISAYLLHEQRARGQHVSQRFLPCCLMVDGIWLLVELYSLVYSSRASLSEEIDLMCTRTRRWIESGHSSFGAQRALFWLDSAIGFASAMLQFAFADQMLKIVIRREYIITGIHEMYAREFACQCLAPAIVSLVASFQFPIGQQKHYIAQRILTQSLLCALNALSHFGVGLFSPAHTVPFVLSFFHCALLLVIRARVGAEEALEGRDEGAAGNGGPGSTTYVLRSAQKSR